MNPAKMNARMNVPRPPKPAKPPKGPQTMIGALRGPVIMITIGVLFLLDQFTPFDFGRTWPLILIVLGLMALAGGRTRPYITGQNVPPGIYPPGAYPPGSYPAGTYPPGTYPPGTYPAGAYPPPAGTPPPNPAGSAWGSTGYSASPYAGGGTPQEPAYPPPPAYPPSGPPPGAPR